MKNKKKQNKNLLITCTILMILTLCMSNLLVNYTFNIGEYVILYSVVVYPFVYFLQNIITKYYDAKSTLAIIIIGLISIFVFSLVYNQISDIDFSRSVIAGSIAAFGISSLINTYLYSYYLVKKSNNYFILLLIYFIVLLIDNTTFLFTIKAGIDLMTLVYSSIIRTSVAVILSYVDIKILKKKK